MEKKVMSDYSCFCTEAQTRKAIELGAPIKNISMFKYNDDKLPKYVHKNEWDRECFSYCPTAEQMISWLEEQYLYITIRYTNDVAKHWQADIDHACYIDPKCGWNLVDFNFASRKEATIAAIDAALDYLLNNKKK